MRRVVFRIVLAGMALAVAGTLIVLTGTAGPRFFLRVAAEALPGTLTVQSVQGGLVGPLVLEGIAYRDEEVEVAVGSLALSWQPASLLRGQLQVESLAVHGLDLQFMETEEDALLLPPLVLPLPVTVEKVSFQSLRFFVPGDPEPLSLERLQLEKVQARGDRLAIGGLEAVAAAGRLRFGGEVRTGGDYPGQWAGEYLFHPPDFSPMTGTLEVAGPLARLAVRVDLAAPFRATLRGTLHDLLGDTRWSAEVRADRAGLTEISKEWPEVVLEDFFASGSGTLEEYALKVEADADYAPLATIHLRTGIVGDGGGLALSDLRLGRDDETLAGEARLAWRDAFSWQASVAGERISLAKISSAWPAAVLSGFRAVGQGKAEEYSLQVETDLAYAQLQDLHAAGNIAGNGQGLRFTDLRLHHLDALLTGEGQLAWRQGLAWQAAVSGTGIDPAAWQPQWPGRLAFRLTTAGELEDDALRGSIDLAELHGTLRDYPVQGGGRIEMANGDLRIDGLALHSADATLRVSGRYAERTDLDFELHAPDLAALWPDAGGSLKARARLQGERSAPSLRAELTGTDLALADSAVASVAATMEGDLAPGGSLAGSIRATGATVAGMEINRVSAELQGTTGKHQLQAEALADGNSVRLQVAGELTDAVWQGVIGKAELREECLGNWQLAEPAPMLLSAQEVSVDQFCLHGPSAGRICLAGGFAPAGPWQAAATIEAFPLELVPEDLLQHGRLEGQLSGRAEVEGESAGIHRGSASLAVTEGTLHLAHGDEGMRKIAWQRLGLAATLAGEHLAAQVEGKLADGGALSASLRLEDLRLAPFSLEQSRIDAGGQLEIRDLQPLDALLYPTAAPTGSLHGEFRLRGRAAEPEITAFATLAEGEVRILPLGIVLRELAVKLAGSFPEYRLEASGRSGGAWQGLGMLSLADTPELRLDIRGEGVELARLPELDLLASPDLTAVLRRDRSEVRGTIRIPQARIAPRDLAGTVQPSADVVIVDSRQEPAQPAWPLAADLVVIAGDDVRVDAFGLRGKVGGRLQVTDLPGKPVTGDGILSVSEGTFAIYGRELTIRTGRLVYSGTPIDNPGVEVRAESTSDNITTGIQVSGFLAAPEISFYSEPPMAEDEIISRLLMNTALLGSAEGDRTFLGSLTGRTGLEPLTATVRGVKESLRLDEVKITSGKTREDLSLVIGTWLTPELYVSYGKNLLKESGSFNTRYLLGRGFSIQTETGATQSGIDLKYEIDRY